MYKCCICGSAFKGMGNNPAPLCNVKGALCCDECNNSVMRIRFKQYMLNRKNGVK